MGYPLRRWALADICGNENVENVKCWKLLEIFQAFYTKTAQKP